MCHILLLVFQAGSPRATVTRGRQPLLAGHVAVFCQRWQSTETTTQETEEEYHSIIKDTERGK
ncbi:hypothetical protein BaRGS_00004982, partial [Batillaria attramentaria]